MHATTLCTWYIFYGENDVNTKYGNDEFDNSERREAKVISESNARCDTYFSYANSIYDSEV